MHQVALGSGVVTGGIGGIVALVILILGYVLRITTRMSRRNQRYTSTRWTGEAPGGGFRQQEPGAAPATLSAEEQKGRERAHAYWEAEQPPEGTLPAEGFIGEDIAPPTDAARDPDPTGH
jgi:hypothetical protein